jgi:hypothetical protein
MMLFIEDNFFLQEICPKGGLLSYTSNLWDPLLLYAYFHCWLLFGFFFGPFFAFLVGVYEIRLPACHSQFVILKEA